jgi:hypothetical protein
MSKEEYLKGDKRIKARQIIKTCLGVRMRPDETLSRLEKHGIKISERTYRRLKLELYEDAGKTVREIITKNIAGTLVDEIFTYDEMERRCWEMFYETKSTGDKIRLLSLLRQTSQDKLKVRKNFPTLGYNGEIEYSKIRDDLADLDSEGDNSEKED